MEIKKNQDTCTTIKAKVHVHGHLIHFLEKTLHAYPAIPYYGHFSAFNIDLWGGGGGAFI
jgi:hypothetical protein